MTGVEKKQFLFSDYAFLNSIKSLPTGRLCELAILRELSLLGYPLQKAYDHDEHVLLWNELNALFDAKGETSAVMNTLLGFAKQYSPIGNELFHTSANHISHYVKLAIDVANVLQKPANIIELGANHGTLSYTLSILGNAVLCTDIHHSMIGSSIESYKMGTWFRECFIGLVSTASYVYPTDGVENLDIFENGLDAVVMRGTGVLTAVSAVTYASCHKEQLIKLFRKLNIDYTHYATVLHNCLSLIQILNPGGTLYASEENIFYTMPPEVRTLALEALVKDLSAFGVQAKYTIRDFTYANEGWKPFTVTLCCKK